MGAGWWGFKAITKEPTPVASTAPSPSKSPKLCPAAKKIAKEDLGQNGDIRVRVINGTPKSGWAGANADKLRERGFQVDGTGNDDSGRAVAGQGELRYGDQGAKAAAKLSLYMPGAKLVPSARAASQVDVVLGPDFAKFLSIYAVDQKIAKGGSINVPLTPKPCK